MNMKLLKGKAGSRSGVTLVELLVVILIVVILSVSLLPLLKPFITDAQYAAEPIPVIGNLRTMVAMYYYNKNYLPGLPHQDSSVFEKTPYISGLSGEDSRLCTFPAGTPFGTPLQTFVGMRAAADEPLSYCPTVYNTIGLGGTLATGYTVTETKLGITAPATVATAAPDNMTDHVSNHINVDYQDLTGKRVKPKHFQYRAISGGYKTGAYAYVLGVFGDADGLPAGTGYAVIEIVNPFAEVKYVGTWSRNKTVSGDAGQILIMDGEEDQTVITSSNPADAKKANICWIGAPTKYLSTTTKTDVQEGIQELIKAGWEF